MKKKVSNGGTSASAWEVTMTQTKPVHKFECGKCKRKIQREKDAYAPWCVDCFDEMMAFFGLERMVDKGPVKQKPTEVLASWAQVGKALKPTRKRVSL